MPIAYNLAGFMYVMHALCVIHHGSVTSWMRSKARNDYLGGNPHSFHLDGLAVDVVLDNPASNDGFIANCTALGLQAIDEGDHIHVEADNAITRLGRA